MKRWDESSTPFRLCVTLGDPQGIGPEVAARALEEVAPRYPEVFFRVFGDPGAYAAARPSMPGAGRVEFEPVAMETTTESAPSAAAGAAAIRALMLAAECCESGLARGIVTAPVSKAAIARRLAGFRGHTGWLGERWGVEPLMLLATRELRVFLATDHLPLAAVPSAITPGRLDRVLGTAHRTLVTAFGHSAPRLAVLGLNPHAGEDGELGREEIEVVRPAIERAGGEAAGFHGPFSADSFFRDATLSRFDGVVALYHDQGLIPLKAKGFGRAVNVSLGLPFLRTSPDHGTGFDIAGRGVADAGSMVEALEWAVALAGGRALCPPSR